MAFYLSDNQDPWSKPGPKSEQQDNGSEQQEPKQQNNQQPPDLEEAFSSLVRKMGGKKDQNGNQQPASFGKFIPAIIALATVIGALLVSILYKGKRGVVTRFGKLNQIVLPGLNWKPTFIDEVIPVNIERVMELNTSGSVTHE